MSIQCQFEFNISSANQIVDLKSEETFDITHLSVNTEHTYIPRTTTVVSPTSGDMLIFDGYRTYIECNSKHYDGQSFTMHMGLVPIAFESLHTATESGLIDCIDYTKKTGFKLVIESLGVLALYIGNGATITAYNTPYKLKALSYTTITLRYSSKNAAVTLFINDRKPYDISLPHKLLKSSASLQIGRNGQNKAVGLFHTGFFCGAFDYLHITNTSTKTVPPHNACTHSYTPLELWPVEDITDPNRPQFHLLPPRHWMNEPHAPFYYNNRYHLFYQHNPFGPYFSNLHWGHFSSEDLVFWQHHPPALRPELEAQSPAGIWSGSAVFDPFGIPSLFYTFATTDPITNQGVALAQPNTLTDPDLTHWHTIESVRIPQTLNQGLQGEFRDPFVFYDAVYQGYIMLVGGGDNTGPTAWVYTSRDMNDWIFQGKFFEINIGEYPKLGINWELPVLLPIEDETGNQKFVFIFMSSFPTGNTPVDTFYFIGNLNRETFMFDPDHKDPRLIDYGTFILSGPSGFIDPKKNKAILFTIMQGARSQSDEFMSGWAHNAGLPLELSLWQGDLHVQPLSSLENLRSEDLINCKNLSYTDANEALSKLEDTSMLEIVLTVKPHVDKLILQLNTNHPDKNATTYAFNFQTQTCHFKQYKDNAIVREGGGTVIYTHETTIRLFIDHSALECFVNNHKSISLRSYTLPFKTTVSLNGVNQKPLESLQVYKMHSIWRPKRKD